MSKLNYILLALLALSIAGNIMQSQRYSELAEKRTYIYDGTVEHLRATLKRELRALSAVEEEARAKRETADAPDATERDGDSSE